MRILGSNKAEVVPVSRVYLCSETYNILTMKELELYSTPAIPTLGYYSNLTLNWEPMSQYISLKVV